MSPDQASAFAVFELRVPYRMGMASYLIILISYTYGIPVAQRLDAVPAWLNECGRRARPAPPTNGQRP